MHPSSFAVTLLRLLDKAGLIRSKPADSDNHHLSGNDKAPTQAESLLRRLIDSGDLTLDQAYRTAAEELHIEYTISEIPDPEPETLQVVHESLARMQLVLPLSRDRDKLRLGMANPTDILTIDEIAISTGCKVVPVLVPRWNLVNAIDRCYRPAVASGTNRSPESDNQQKKAILQGKTQKHDSWLSSSEDSDSTDWDLLQLDDSSFTAREPAGDNWSHSSGEAWHSGNHTGMGVFDMEKDVEEAINRLLRKTVMEAIEQDASDIHFEPADSAGQIRLRIDGVLQENLRIPTRIHNRVIGQLKLLSGMNTAEKRLPQDGRLRIESAGAHCLDARVSCIPSVRGESLVLRLLDRFSIRSMEELGFSEWGLEQSRRLIQAADGLILTTGPAGSGKTTTLYAFLKSLDAVEQKIITIEDPVEYQLPGICQTRIQPAAGLTFASALKAILRQSPDVIVVGEIRDRETARTAVHAAQTGHLVMSTLHSGNTAGAVARLLDLQVEPYLLSDCLRVVYAQRLARLNCAVCSVPFSPDSAMQSSLRERIEALVTRRRIPETAEISPIARSPAWHAGKGCHACFGTGYRGRTGLYEILLVTDAIKAMINNRRAEAEMFRTAREEGLLVLHENALIKAMRGIIPITEYQAVFAASKHLPQAVASSPKTS